MKRRYRVKTEHGVDLGGRIVGCGQEFVPAPKHADWARLAAAQGSIELVEPAKNEAKPRKGR